MISHPTTSDDLKSQVQTARWFARLGESETARKGVTWVEPMAFRDHIAAHSTPSVLLGSSWLPTTQDETDPIHGNALELAVSAPERAAALKAVRMDIARLAHTSLRAVAADLPSLVVGPTNLTVAAKGAAVYACRRAATEIIAGEPGFWCEVIPLYHAGYWPFGITDDGALLVL